MKEFCYVYILRSVGSGRFYTGMSANPDTRLIQHNEGISTSTRPYRPWCLVWVSDVLEKTEALGLEKKIKKRGAQRFLVDNGIQVIFEK